MKFLEKVAEQEDLRLNTIEKQENNYYIELEYWSDLGEDCIISLVVPELTEDAIRHAMYDNVESFDAEEHATTLYNLHGAHGTPTGLRELLTDADSQYEKLQSIYKTMLGTNIMNNKTVITLSLDEDDLKALQDINLIQDIEDEHDIQNGIYTLIYQKVEETKNFDV